MKVIDNFYSLLEEISKNNYRISDWQCVNYFQYVNLVLDDVGYLRIAHMGVIATLEFKA